MRQKVAIAVDDWKLKIFREKLTEAGYEYTDAGAFTADTTILTVETDNIFKLQGVLKDCQRAAKNSKK